MTDVEQIKDAIEARLAEMYKNGLFVDFEDMIAVAECFLDKFGIETTEDEIESIVKCAAGL